MRRGLEMDVRAIPAPKETLTRPAMAHWLDERIASEAFTKSINAARSTRTARTHRDESVHEIDKRRALRPPARHARIAPEAFTKSVKAGRFRARASRDAP
ncbi:hypothetical protein [Sorangium sp. So ce861]|uniref:hypothetical protein n=1 Tax=Sorangium sp. So ce861 TaxID=3133323 RepID=UPI003F639539